ncbi:MAG: NAD(P)/FAD-dependent oxidoreductase [Candidatus Lokiarchaeota archaeon]|nr:NAD(P)/FAD-dependent oxidoreductase [Candidatus Lokiarchaeota archaeon]
MTYRIIIAGAGHGGLSAGIILARQGLDVSLHEACSRDALGHDWHDDFFLETFQEADLPSPAPGEYAIKCNVSFHGPDMRSVISTSVPEARREIQMDRKALYARLLTLAESAGVKLNFNSRVTGPLLHGQPETVRGLIVNGKELAADLVIDAAGVHSPVRRGLPAGYRIEPTILAPDIFYTYRAYYSLVPGKPCDPTRFNIHFLFDGIRGIAWFRVVDGLADLFFGQISPLTPTRVDELLLAMKRVYPALGETRMRGGQFNTIPIRRALPVFVGDGYAAVGDAACMAVPLTGSGIQNALVAGRMLADTARAACASMPAKPFSARSLWSYEVAYYKKIGARMASIDCIKRFLLDLPARDLDFILAKRLIAEKEIIAASAGSRIQLGFKDMMGKLARGSSRLPLLLSLKKAVDRAGKAAVVASSIPTVHDPEAIACWARELDEVMSPRETAGGWHRGRKA